MGTPVLIELHYLPSIAYIKAIAGNAVLFEAHEHFTKQTYRNRCRIAGANGVLDLIVPVKKKSAKIPVKELEIMYAEKWQHTHHMAVHSAYRSSPYYDYFEDDIKRLFFTQHKYLLDYSLMWLEWVTKTLKITLNHSFTAEYTAQTGEGISDLRNTISPKIETGFVHPHYTQVFEEKQEFIPNLSILDWICNDLQGARSYYAS
jgi:hypothetical protein